MGILVAVPVAACEPSYRATPASADGAITDSSAVDASSVDSGNRISCDVRKPFEAPRSVLKLNEASAQDTARIAPNGLELYLTRDSSGIKQLFRYTRSDPNSVWSNGTLQVAFSIATGIPAQPISTSHSSMAFVDDQRAYLSIFPGGNDGSIYFAQRDTPSAQWNTPVAVTVLGDSAEYSYEYPWLSASGGTLYFSRKLIKAAAGYQLFSATRRTNTVFNPAQSVLENLAPDLASVFGPVLSSDELTLYMGGEVESVGGRKRSIYSSSRANISSAFSKPVLVPELAGGSISQPSWLSSDGCEIYLSSNRNGGFLIFSARKPN